MQPLDVKICIYDSHGNGRMRKILTLPKKRALTQGMIFSAATAEGYGGKEVYGLIVTARCDIAHDKIESFHYLPVVTLRDWMDKSGLAEVKHRVIENTISSMKGILKDSNFTTSILDALNPLETDPLETMDALFPDNPKNRNVQKIREKFSKYIKDQSDARSLDHISTAVEFFPKVVSSLASEVIKNKITGLYFLENVEPSGSDIGYVVLLREIQKIPKSLAMLIETGIEKAGYEDHCKASIASRGILEFELVDYCMPVSQVTSPYVEHIMQAFSSVFSRIGVDDISKTYIDTLWARQTVGGK